MADNRSIFKLGLSFLMVFLGIALTLFRHWEFSGESWGYWLFARIFAETGRFIVLDRSPFYILYLYLFHGLRYPAAVIVEYIVTSLIVSVTLIVFLRRYIGTFLASFAVFLWLPFLQSAEPPMQKLTLALSCIAVMIREVKNSRFYLAVSYALLICAYAMRSTYMIFIIIFAMWDSVRIFRQKRLKGLLLVLCPQKNDWPIFVAVALLIWFNVMQSPHPWNNPWFATTKWFPVKGKVMANDTFIQFSNWQYIYDKYGTFKDKDFYFTNQELFKGVTTIMGALRVNPRFVFKQIIRNSKKLFCVIGSLTMLPSFFYRKFPQIGLFYYVVVLLFTMPFVVAILYGALRSCRSRNIMLFLISNVFLAVATILFLPRTKYMHPIIPIFILSAFWYSHKIYVIFDRKWKQYLDDRRLSKVLGNIVAMIFIIFFSNGLVDWTQITRDFARDITNREIKIMSRRPNSFNIPIKEVEPLVFNCRGILSLEHRFLGAFADIPLTNIYDVWEIPPFGQLDSSNYKGLRPDRIDCVIVSKELASGVGLGTNHQIRYQNYIKPYEEQLKNMGAITHNIEGFGEVVTLSPKKLK